MLFKVATLLLFFMFVTTSLWGIHENQTWLTVLSFGGCVSTLCMFFYDDDINITE